MQQKTVSISDNITSIQTTFDRCFDASENQKQIFKSFQPYVDKVTEGYNLTIFAYGQTGSGITQSIQAKHTPCLEAIGKGLYRSIINLHYIRTHFFRIWLMTKITQVLPLDQSLNSLIILRSLGRRMSSKYTALFCKSTMRKFMIYCRIAQDLILCKFMRVDSMVSLSKDCLSTM